ETRKLPLNNRLWFRFPFRLPLRFPFRLPLRFPFRLPLKLPLNRENVLPDPMLTVTVVVLDGVVLELSATAGAAPKNPATAILPSAAVIFVVVCMVFSVLLL